MAIIIPERIRSFNFVLIGGDGKQPFEKAWQKKIHRVDDPVLQRHLGLGKNYGVQCNNSSVIIDGKPFFLVVIDFDRKEIQDKVIDKLPETFTTTSGSPKKCVHLWFASDNNKAFKIKDEQLDTLVDFLGAGNQVIAPGSKHPSGSIYSVVKDVPIVFVPYSELKAVLQPYDKSPKKAEPVQKQYQPKNVKDDITGRIYNQVSMRDILDTVGVDTSKTPTNCPFHSSKGGKCFGWDNETAHCFHCDDKWNKFSLIRQYLHLSDKETFDWFAEKSGMTEELKKSRRDYIEKNKPVQSSQEKSLLPELKHPGLGRLITQFAIELSHILKDKSILFYRTSTKSLVEVGKVRPEKEKEDNYEGFIEIKPSRFITLIERFVTPGVYILNEETKELEFKKKSIGSDLANTLICSEVMQTLMPRIKRIYTIPLPIIHEGTLTFPKKGYDERFYSWLPNDAPDISDMNMSLEESKKILDKIFDEFCFKSKRDKDMAIAALLTPFLRGLFISPTTRTPIFGYLANRERCGKDYCAGVTGIVYEGIALEESPISTNEKNNNTEELRKKILSTMIMGRKRLHFSNNKGFINNPALEAIITAEQWIDRVLGRSELLSFDNEIDFSFSGNVGVSFTADFANRSRFINFFLDIEDANSRTFNRPNLHEWVKENRSLVLSALFGLVKNWIDQESPKGSIPFASFHEWSEVCGGIMETSGYENPCLPDKESMVLGGDYETTEMKKLFEYCYEKRPNERLTKTDVRELIRIEPDLDIFSRFDMSIHSDVIRFGLILSKFAGRILSDVKMNIFDNSVRSARQTIIFVKESEKNSGSVGNVGSTINPVGKKEEFYILGGTEGKTVPTLPSLPENDIVEEKIEISTGTDGVEEDW